MENENNNYVHVLMETEKYDITGKIELPDPSVVDNPTIDNLLFYSLNCGNKFIPLSECILSAKDKIEYQSEEIEQFNVNLSIVQTCRIINK